MSACKIKYNGNGQADHIAASFRLKGDVYKSGETYEVTPERAGLLKKSCPEGSLEIISGTPVYESVMPARVKAAVRAEADIRKRFPLDPAAALASVGTLPKKALTTLKAQVDDGEAALAAVDAGDFDKCLANLAVLAKLMGADSLAKACVRRAETLLQKAAGS